MLCRLMFSLSGPCELLFLLCFIAGTGCPVTSKYGRTHSNKHGGVVRQQQHNQRIHNYRPISVLPLKIFDLLLLKDNNILY